MLAIQATRTGGPEVLEAVDLPMPTPGPGEILIRHEAIGLNFIDTYYRTGLYPARLPGVMGVEGAGIVEAIGEGVTRFQVGDRAAYAGGPLGAYAEARVYKADRAVKLPEGVSSEVAAAAMLKDGIWPAPDRDPRECRRRSQGPLTFESCPAPRRRKSAVLQTAGGAW